MLAMIKVATILLFAGGDLTTTRDADMTRIFYVEDKQVVGGENFVWVSSVHRQLADNPGIDLLCALQAPMHSSHVVAWTESWSGIASPGKEADLHLIAHIALVEFEPTLRDGRIVASRRFKINSVAK